LYPVNSRKEFGVDLDMTIMRCVLTLALASATALGQEFEVASVKRNVLSDRVVSIRVDPGGSFNARGYSLKLLIQRAYDIKGYQVSGGPSWLDEDRWDVTARAPRSGSDNWKPEQVNAMLRALLADRFRLKAHMTTKEMPGIVLLVARGGSKMKVSSAAEEKIWRERADVVVEGATPASIAVLLGAYLAMPVRDQTGLEGRYDFRLHWTGRADSVSSVAEDDLSSSLPLPRAVIEQLGLKLADGNVRANILVIDAAQKASAN
jgi:uncharacterized protein (TIGR03435 family)